MLKRIISLAAFWGALSFGCEMNQVRLPSGLSQMQRVTALKESCEQGRAPACYMLGFIYQYGQGVPENKIFSNAYYRQACKLGLKEACTDPTATPPGPPLVAGGDADEQRLVDACDSGERNACEDLSNRGVRRLKEDHDVKQAATLWMHACKQKVGAACLYLGAAFESEDPKFAAEAYNKACDNGSGAGCLRLAKLLAQVKSSESITLALRYFNKACEAGENDGCVIVASVVQRACDTQNLADACAAYAVLLLQGKGVSVDFNKGKQYARKACRLGSQSGCKLEESTP